MPGPNPPYPPARRELPAWLGPAGLVAGLLFAGSYALFVRDSGGALWSGLDLGVYQAAGAAARRGEAVYELAVGRGRMSFTYPPVTLTVFEPLSLLGPRRALSLVNLAGLAALVATVWLVLGTLGYRRDLGRAGAALGVAGLATWLEPVLHGFALGQVNIFLMLLVVADMSLRDDRRFKGVGIGLAAAAKLTPGLFVVFLLVTGRRRAATVAAGTFLAAAALAALRYPGDSWAYWSGTFLDSGRVAPTSAGPGYAANQSLHGLLVRTLDGSPWAGRLWLPLAAAALAAGLWLAALAHRRGEAALAMLLCAFTALLVSPVSWTHHWVWVVPGLVVLADLAGRARGRAQPLLAGLLGAVVLMLFAWPSAPPGGSPLPTGVVPALPSNHYAEYRWTPPQMLLGEMYTLCVLALFAVAAWWLVRARRAAGERLREQPRV